LGVKSVKSRLELASCSFGAELELRETALPNSAWLGSKIGSAMAQAGSEPEPRQH